MAIGQGLINTLRGSRRKLDWFLTTKGMIRARRKVRAKGKAKATIGGTFCPLTGAAYAETGERLTLDDTGRAAELLDINDDLKYDESDSEFEKNFISAVIEAADGKTKQPKLRARILRAVGLSA